VALVGPSGAGKSTLLRTLAAADRPFAGTVQVGGIDPWTLGGTALRALRRRAHLAPQTPPLPPRQRVASAVAAGRLPQWSLRRTLAAVFGTPDIALAHAALERLELGARLHDRVDRLSGGERQRVALARALVADVEVLFVDEPLSALDPTLALRALGCLLETARERAVTLVCSLHQIDLARAHFTRLIAIRDGAVFHDGPTDTFDDARLTRLYRGHEDELHGERTSA